MIDRLKERKDGLFNELRMSVENWRYLRGTPDSPKAAQDAINFSNEIKSIEAEIAELEARYNAS